MSITVQAVCQPKLAVTETVSGVGQGVAPGAYNHDQVSNTTLNTTSNPTAVAVWSGRVTMSGGAASLDLTALPYSLDREDVDLTTLKVVALKLFAPLTNADPVKIEGGASTPYELFGDADTEIDLAPGEYATKGVVDSAGAALAAVSGSVKVIDFSGTGTDAVDVTIVAGT